MLATVDSRDYAGASTDEIVDAARRLDPGGIMLMHDWPRATIVAVTPIAEVLADRGLCPGRIVESATSRAVAVKP